MKKIITLTLLTLISLNISAQKIEKGIWQIEIGTGIGADFSWVTGGSYEILQKDPSGTTTSDGDWSDLYNSQSDLSYDLDFTNFSNWEQRFLNGVSFGYFFADGWLVGLGLDLDGLNSADSYEDDESAFKTNQFSIGAVPKIRYYIPTARGNAMFIESSIGLGISSYSTIIESDGAYLDPSLTIPTFDIYGNPIPTLDSDDTYEMQNSRLSTNIGIGFGYSFFSFHSREIFAIEPMIGFNFNSTSTSGISTYYDDSADEEYVYDRNDKTSSMGAYFKLKLAFYLGRHFWSH